MYDTLLVEAYGNLCTNPEHKLTTGGTELLELNIATTFAPKRDKETGKPIKDQKPNTVFSTIELYDDWMIKRAELWLKGCKIYVKGRIKVNSWVDKNTGAARSKIIIQAERLYQIPKIETDPEPTL